jgi:hypothetical protein
MQRSSGCPITTLGHDGHDYKHFVIPSICIIRHSLDLHYPSSPQSVGGDPAFCHPAIFQPVIPAVCWAGIQKVPMYFSSLKETLHGISTYITPNRWNLSGSPGQSPRFDEKKYSRSADSLI